MSDFLLLLISRVLINEQAEIWCSKVFTHGKCGCNLNGFQVISQPKIVTKKATANCSLVHTCFRGISRKQNVTIDAFRCVASSK